MSFFSSLLEPSKAVLPLQAVSAAADADVIDLNQHRMRSPDGKPTTRVDVGTKEVQKILRHV